MYSNTCFFFLKHMILFINAVSPQYMQLLSVPLSLDQCNSTI